MWAVADPVRALDSLNGICQTERWANGHVRYAFEVDPGRYEVVLHFAETNPNFFGKAKRQFDIVVNDQTAAEKVDIFSEAGGSMTAWEFRKTADVTGRELKIGVSANPTGPAIKGIEVRGLSPK